MSVLIFIIIAIMVLLSVGALLRAWDDWRAERRQAEIHCKAIKDMIRDIQKNREGNCDHRNC